nr:hypothetical protein [Tanacetum cinerariifolium]
MNPNSSLGKICLGEAVVVISSDKVKGSEDWNFPKFQDTANSGKKKETKAMVFYQIETEEVSDRFVAPCFVNGLEAYDGEINLGVEENMISNEYAVKLCLEHEVKKGTIVVNFLESFLRMTKAITDFGVGTITIYHDIDPLLEETKREEMSNDDWDHLLDFNIDDVPFLGKEGPPPFVNVFISRRSFNSRRSNQRSNRIRISQKFTLLKEERPIIDTMAYKDKYKKILDEVWKDKVELDGKIVKEEDAVKKIKGETLKEKDDPEAFVFLIRLERQTMETHDDEVGSSRSKCPRQPETVEEDVLNRMGYDGEIDDLLRIRLREAGSDEEIFTSVAWIRDFNINEPIYAELCHEFYSTYEFDEVCVDDELQTKKIIKFRLGERAHNLTLLEFARRLGLYQAVELEEEGFNVYFEGEDVVRSLSALIYCRDMDTITLRYLIDFDGKLNLQDPQPGVPRVGIPRPSRASMQDLYNRMGRMEIRQEAIERMEYRQSYHWDRLSGRTYNLTLLEFARRLGLYQAVELEEEGFNVYFEGSLRNDEHFNA